MKQKQLASLLQQVDGFSDPKIRLEQYQTSCHITSAILLSERESFEGKSVVDFGCGTGILTAGPLFLGADHVLGIDVDPDALSVCQRNLVHCFHDDDESSVSYDLLLADVTQVGRSLLPHGTVDCVIMNPPFGTRNPGIDLLFLQSALSLCPDVVYSLHKTSTRQGIHKRCKEWNVDMQVLAEVKFDLPATYKFHTKKSTDVLVDFIRFSHK